MQSPRSVNPFRSALGGQSPRAINPFRDALAARAAPVAPPAQGLPRAMESAFVRGAVDVPLSTAQTVARLASTAQLLPDFEAMDQGGQPPGLLDISRPPGEKTILREYAAATPERRAEMKTAASRPLIDNPAARLFDAEGPEERAAALQPGPENPLYAGAERIRERVKQAFPIAPEQEKRFPTQAAGGLGSTVGFAATQIASRALGLPGALITAATGAATASQAQFQQAVESGATFEQATRASKISGLAGLSEAVPISRFLDRFDKATGGTIRKTFKEGIKGGLEEAGQEVFQTVVDNATAAGIYDPERGLFQGAPEAGGVGFTVGGLMSFLAASLGARMRGGPEPTPPPGGIGQPPPPGAAPGPQPGPPSPAAGARAAGDMEARLEEVLPGLGERAYDIGVPEPGVVPTTEGQPAPPAPIVPTTAPQEYRVGVPEPPAGSQGAARARLEDSRRKIEATEAEIAARQERIDEGRERPTIGPIIPAQLPARRPPAQITYSPEQVAAMQPPPERPPLPDFRPIRPPPWALRPPSPEIAPETAPEIGAAQFGAPIGAEIGAPAEIVPPIPPRPTPQVEEVPAAGPSTSCRASSPRRTGGRRQRPKSSRLSSRHRPKSSRRPKPRPKLKYRALRHRERLFCVPMAGKPLAMRCPRSPVLDTSIAA